MKNLIPIALLALTVVACKNKSAISTSGISNEPMVVNSILVPTGTETGIRCEVATNDGRQIMFIQGLKDGSKIITLHEIYPNDLDEEGHDLYQENMTLLNRKLPSFELDGKINKKNKYTEARAKETVRIQITEDYDDPTNPDKVKPGMVITGIKYQLRLPNNQEAVGDISRAFEYEKARGFMGNQGRTGDMELIGDISDCQAVNAQPKIPPKKPATR